jgi:hypothetical protein
VPGQAQLGQHLVHPCGPLGHLGVSREAQLGGVLQRAPGGQLGVQDVLLRHQADAIAELAVVLVEVPVVVPDGAGVGGMHPGQRAEQRRLARAAGPDDAEQALLRNRERHPVEQHLARRHLHEELVRGDGDLALVDVMPQVAVPQPEGRAPDADDVAFGQRVRGDPAAVHVDPVVAIQVDDLVAARGELAQLRVKPGDLQVGQHQVVVRGTADAHPGDRERHHRGRGRVHAQLNSFGLPARRGHSGDHGGQLGRAAQHRPVLRVPQPDHRVSADLDAAGSPHAEKRSVGAVQVGQDPGVFLEPQLRVPPRDALVGQRDGGRWVPADAVGGARLELVLGLLAPDHELGQASRAG